MHRSPEEEAAIRAEFHRLTNMDQSELRAWLGTPRSRKGGMIRRGETESVGRRSARRNLEIRDRSAEDLTDADYSHLAQRPYSRKTGGDIMHTRWRWSLMNWRHDPLEDLWKGGL